MRKKQEAATVYKNPQLQEAIIRQYKDAGLDFTIKHSNYNTQIIGNNTILKFVQNEHPIRVFIAYNKIVKDLKQSERTVEILQENWSTENFDSKNGLGPCKYKRVVNLDISSAYPYCLFINKLITWETFSFLMNLKKSERLPAIGMIAKKSILIEYKNGKSTNWDLKVGEYANIFFFVIQQISDLMNWAAEIAGNDFLFYWVDGIFLRPGIKKDKLKQITDIFAEQGYYYKFEVVTDFSITRSDNKLFINMLKNKEAKAYTMYDKNMARNFTKILQSLEDAQNPLYIS